MPRRRRAPAAPRSLALLLLVAASLCAGCLAQPVVITSGAAVTLSNTPGAGVTVPPTGKDLEVYADTVTIAGSMLSLAGGDGGDRAADGGRGQSVKIVARRLACATPPCTIDTSGGDGFNWDAQAEPFLSFFDAANQKGAPGANGGNGGAAGSILIQVAQLDANFTFRAHGGNGGKGQVGGDGAGTLANLGKNGANGQGGAGGQVVVLQQETYADYYLQAKGGAGAEQNLTAKLVTAQLLRANHTCRGEDILSGAGYSDDGCAAGCEATPTCTHFVFLPLPGSCYLKSGCSSPMAVLNPAAVYELKRDAGSGTPAPRGFPGSVAFNAFPGYPASWTEGVNFRGALEGLNVPDARACANACFKAANCGAWTFTPAGINGKSCWFKPPTGWTEVVSPGSLRQVNGLSLKTGATTAAAFILPGVVLAGGDITTAPTSVRSLSVEGCAERCRARTGCAAFSLVGNQCRFKRNSGWSLQAAGPGAVSGRPQQAVKTMSLPATAAGDAPASSTFYETGVKFSGGDLEPSAGGRTTESACYARCHAKPACKAWTLLANKRCVLKKGSGWMARASAGITSGLMVREAGQQVGAVGSLVVRTATKTSASTLFSNMDLKGADVGANTSVPTARECASQCYARAGCGSWTYIAPAKVCFFKAPSGWDPLPKLLDEGFISGLVQNGIAGSGVLGDTPAAFFAVGVDAAKAALARKDAAAPSQIDFLRLLAPTCSGVTCAALRKALAALGGGGATSGDDGPVTPGPVVPPPVPSNASVCNNGLCLLGVPGRFQYDQNNGYCGELTIQMLMLRYGVWIPQEVARASGGGELLPGVNYDQALRGLKIAYDKFNGAGYGSFIAWAKEKVRSGLGVVTVVFLTGSRFSGYDHIIPMVGVQFDPSGSATADIVYMNTNYHTAPVQRRTGDYTCSQSNKKDDYARAGCVPTDTSYGYALKGPQYLGIGPRTELLDLSSPKEPGLGRSVVMRATLRMSGLTPGQAYTLYQVSSLAAVPTSPTFNGALNGAVVDSFTADAEQRSMPVTFDTGRSSYYIVAAR